jgi:hypothetical protein
VGACPLPEGAEPTPDRWIILKDGVTVRVEWSGVEESLSGWAEK